MSGQKFKRIALDVRKKFSTDWQVSCILEGYPHQSPSVQICIRYRVNGVLEYIRSSMALIADKN